MIEILIKDKEAELAGLRSECTEKASELTDILISIDTAKKERIALDLEKEEFSKYCEEKRIELKVSNDQINAGKKNLEDLKESSTKELNHLKNDIKTANKELSLANDRVLLARAELDSIVAVEKMVSQKVLELNRLVEMLPEIQSEILSLEGKRNTLRTEISEMLDSSTLELSQAKETLKLISEEVVKKIEEANQAEYRCKKYTDERNSHIIDYEILVKRFEVTSGRKYPELEVNN